MLRLSTSARLAAQVVIRPEDAIRDIDIVVTSVLRLSEPTRFLNASLLSPGTFVTMVGGLCLGGDHAIEFRRSVHGRLRIRHAPFGEHLNYAGDFAADLGEVLAAPDHWRTDGSARRALIVAGSAVANAAAAALIYKQALAQEIGCPFEKRLTLLRRLHENQDG